MKEGVIPLLNLIGITASQWCYLPPWQQRALSTSSTFLKNWFNGLLLMSANGCKTSLQGKWGEISINFMSQQFLSDKQLNNQGEDNMLLEIIENLGCDGEAADVRSRAWDVSTGRTSKRINSGFQRKLIRPHSWNIRTLRTKSNCEINLTTLP